MRTQPVTCLSPKSIANRLRRVFDEEAVDAAARTTGFMRRKRDITPLALIVACLSSLSTGGTRWLADIQRTLNASLGSAVQYKPFHNQLSKEAFPEFVREPFSQALGQLTLPVLEAIPSDSLARFDDIVIQDGSSMALKDCLADVWPGRFNKVPRGLRLSIRNRYQTCTPSNRCVEPGPHENRSTVLAAECAAHKGERMAKRDDLPIKIDAVSNGEFIPRPLSRALRRVQEVSRERIAQNAAKQGVPRRKFMLGACASATMLGTMNELLGCGGGRYALHPGANVDEAAADLTLRGDEFIFDVQTHHVSAKRPWYEGNVVMSFLADTPQAACDASHWSDCYSRDRFIEEVFLNSDTKLGVLSALAGGGDANPLHAQEAAKTREAVAALEGSPRLRIHGIVLPNDRSMEQTKEDMQALTEQWSIAAWKLYPVWGPDGTGYYLDDDVGLATIEHAVKLGLPLIAVHKGLPLPGQEPEYTRPRDVGPAAKAFPSATFLIYHSGYEHGHTEGPYDPDAWRGVDALINSLKANGIGKDGNVYAELGSTWRDVMRKPDEAAHVLGKLLKYLGEDRILWGTDAIWYGSPQDQIEAFRSFEITQEFQERYGYPALTPERKAKIFGLNGARAYGLSTQEVERAMRRDPVSRAKQEYANRPNPTFRTYGPTSRREVLDLIRWRGGLPT